MEVRQKIWRREANRGWELRGKTIGIVGFGHTGSQFAKKLAGMEMKVLGYDRYLNDYSEGMPWVKEAENLEEIVSQSDIISLHLPLTPETRHLVDAAFIARCKPGFILINTARGACVDTAAVVDGLASGQIGGACLDVFENEKPATYGDSELAVYEQLFGFENVVLTPHIAGWTLESKRLLAETLLQKIKGVF
jgi:D-3-phosphoglycerate dehydrogenase